MATTPETRCSRRSSKSSATKALSCRRTAASIASVGRCPTRPRSWVWSRSAGRCADGPTRRRWLARRGRSTRRSMPGWTMSSETSTNEASPQPAANSIQPWQFFVLLALVCATIVVLLSGAQGWLPDSLGVRVLELPLFGGVARIDPAIIILSALVFAAAGVGIAMLRTLLPLATGGIEERRQALAGRTRVALEREKALVLRSIKELEFDRAMGKLSDKDFAEMSGRLRARAAGLIQQLDAGASYREQIQKEIERRVSKSGRATPTADAKRMPVVCASCGVANDPDARFCKGC